MSARFKIGNNFEDGIYVVVYLSEFGEEVIRSMYDDSSVITMAQEATVKYIYFVSKQGQVVPLTIVFENGQLKLKTLGGKKDEV